MKPALCWIPTLAVILTACAPTREQAIKNYVHSTQMWQISTSALMLGAELRVRRAAIALPEAATDRQIEDNWKLFDESTPLPSLEKQARSIRACFNKIGEPPTDMKDLHEKIRRYTELCEEVAAYEIEHAKGREKPEDVWAVVGQRIMESKDLLSLIRLRLNGEKQ